MKPQVIDAFVEDGVQWALLGPSPNILPPEGADFLLLQVAARKPGMDKWIICGVVRVDVFTEWWPS